MSGNAGSVSGPTAETTKFAVKSPSEVLTCHRASCVVPAHLVNVASEPVPVRDLVLSGNRRM